MIIKETLTAINNWHIRANIFKGDIDFNKNQYNKVLEEIRELETHLKNPLLGDFKWKIMDDLGDIFIAFFNYAILLNNKQRMADIFILKLAKKIKKFKSRIYYYCPYNYEKNLMGSLIENLNNYKKIYKKHPPCFFDIWLILCDYLNIKCNLKTKPHIILECAYMQIKDRKYEIKQGKQIR